MRDWRDERQHSGLVYRRDSGGQAKMRSTRYGTRRKVGLQLPSYDSPDEVGPEGFYTQVR